MRTAIVLACAAVGCAAPKATPIGRAETAIQAADEAGARQSDTASLYLALARHDLAEARRRVLRGDVEGEANYRERAAIDAEIATLIAREAEVRSAVQRSDGEADALEDELERAATRTK